MRIRLGNHIFIFFEYMNVQKVIRDVMITNKAVLDAMTKDD